MVSRVMRGMRTVALLAVCLHSAVALGSDSTTGTPSPDTPEVKRLPGGAVIRTTPGTRLTFDRSIRLQLGPAGSPKTLTHSVRLIAGRIEVDLPASKVPATAVLVRAPNKISAVAKGGRSVVIASPQRVTVAAVSGEMLAATGNEWRPVSSGIVREFSASGTPSDHAVIQAPEVSLSAPIAFHLGSAAEAATSVTASVVPSAVGYDFGIWRIDGGDKTLLQRLTSNSPGVQLPSLEPGSYAVSVRAMERSGLESMDSAAIPLRVVGADLPAGAKLVGDRVVLRPHQRLALRGTEGVEVSYGKAPQFVPAPDSIGLIRGQTTRVRLRASGTTGELAFELEPYTIRADIQIGPSRARWPNDEISVSVRVTDGRGRPLSADVKPLVHVNVTPVALEWKRQNNVLTTVVPRPAEGGPWVVRVEVRDDTGAFVGRDFLEVATDARQAHHARH